MLDVGEQQFLVLLFVVQAEGHHGRDRIVSGTFLEQSLHVFVDVRTIAEYLGKGRP